MSNALSPFTPIADTAGIYTAVRGKLRCIALRLSSGGLCLYSPVAGLGDAARDSLGELGPVTMLLAPNHYHNKAMAAYAAAFPGAQPICTDTARPRLTKITGLTFGGLDTLQAELPADAEVLEPAGLKTGETWVRVRTAAGVAWIVTDAFCGPDGATADTPAMLGTFPTYGVRDKARYRAWVQDRIAEDAPALVIPCHGAMVRSPKLGSALNDLLAQYF